MEQDPEKHISRLYQRLASRDLRDLLDSMLYDLYFTRPCETEGQQALNNYAKELLCKVYADESGVVDSNRFFETVKRVLKLGKGKE